MNRKLKQDINFFEAIGKDKVASSIDFMESVKKSALICAIVSVVVVAFLGGRVIFLSSQINSYNKEIAEMESSLKEVNELKLKSEGLQRDIDKFKTAVVDFGVAQRITLNDIYNLAYAKPSGIIIDSMSFSGNRVSLACKGGTELLTADYANNLRTSVTKNNNNEIIDGSMYTNNFKNVKYTGASGGGGVYSSTIIIELNDRGQAINE